MADDRKIDEPFLQRWARRKADAEKPATGHEESETSAPDSAGVDMRATETAALPQATDAPAEAESGETPAIDLSTLPDIDSLDADSDFSVFMQNGIPAELQKRALQKLWRLDPTFGHIDGLLEYGEDFTGNGLVAEAVNTIYKVGKGMRTDDEDEVEGDVADDAAEIDTADVPDTESDSAAGRPAVAQGAPAENTDDRESDSVEGEKPDRAAWRCDPHRDQ